MFINMAVYDYKRLWAAVLKQAIRDARRELPPHGNVSSHMNAASAKAWFESDSQDIGSFLWICAVLDVEPDYTKTLMEGIDHKMVNVEDLIN